MVAAYDDPHVRDFVRAAAAEIRDKFGITNIGGFATTGHISNSDHYKGLAIDVVTSLKGTLVASYAIANASRWNVKYIIWNRRIWQNGSWSVYSGSSPHTDHVHISFNDGGSTSGDARTTVDPGADPTGCLQKLLDLFNPLA